MSLLIDASARASQILINAFETYAEEPLPRAVGQDSKRRSENPCKPAFVRANSISALTHGALHSSTTAQ